MNLIILGEHSDDKGKQLEKLTTRILSHHGYKNITTNIIKNGGQEIDVEAIHEKPGFGNPDISNVLCECKAYTKAMAMSDWLKFLGKVFISKIGVNTLAYFIALNGVNGNVAGSYQDLKKQHKNIHLVTGEDLLKPLNQIYKMITVEEIQSRVKVLTDRNPTEISICYYNETLYFLLAFVDNTFSILSQNGERLEKDECDQICKLISVNTNHIHYLDLESEKVAKDRKQRIKKYIICIIFEKSDFISFDDLQTKLLSYKEIFDNLTELEINDILTELEEENFLVHINNRYNLHFFSLKRKTGEKIVNFYKYLLSFDIPLYILESFQYDKYINESLVTEICKIQGCLPLDKQQKKRLAYLLKLSPSALIWFLYPDVMITLHREQFPSANERWNKNDLEYLFHKTHQLLYEDFKNLALHKYFLEYRGIIEIEASNTYIVKSNDKVELHLENNERFRIGQMGEDYNNQYTLVKVFPDTEEPWEISKKNHSINERGL